LRIVIPVTRGRIQRPIGAARCPTTVVCQTATGLGFHFRRESVNRCLRTWQQDGVIAIKGGLIVVNDRAAFEQLAEPG
jgi:hypothetical protein